MELQCSNCSQLLTVAPELAGQQVSCPHCGAVLVVPGAQAPAQRPAPAPAPRAAAPAPAGTRPVSALGQPQMLEKKRKGGCWKTGLAVVAVLGVVMLFFWFQDKKLRDYGVDQIEAMGLSDDEELVYLAIANHYHNRAANSGTRATKKSTGTASKSEYWSALEELIEGELGRIPETPDFEAIEGNSYLWREGMEHYIVTLKPGGEYEKAHHWDSDSDYSDAHETATGKWSANEKGFHWKPDDGSEEAQEILRMGRDGFALKISEVEASFWQRRR